MARDWSSEKLAKTSTCTLLTGKVVVVVLVLVLGMVRACVRVFRGWWCSVPLSPETSLTLCVCVCVRVLFVFLLNWHSGPI